MSYSDQQARDERGRFASNGGPSEARAEKIRLGQEADARRYGTRTWDRPSHGVGIMDKIGKGLANKYGTNAPSEAAVRAAMQTGAHTAGIHQATMGRTLAQTSAAGTNPAIPPPKIGGAS
jgi:hypothetical protein